MKEMDTRQGRDRTRRRLKVILLVLLAYIVAIAALAVIIDARHVRFYVTGSDNMTQEFGETYEEPGVYAVTYGKLFGEGTKRLHVAVEGLDAGVVAEVAQQRDEAFLPVSADDHHEQTDFFHWGQPPHSSIMFSSGRTTGADLISR